MYSMIGCAVETSYCHIKFHFNAICSVLMHNYTLIGTWTKIIKSLKIGGTEVGEGEQTKMIIIPAVFEWSR